LELELLTVAMASGGRRRTEGVLCGSSRRRRGGRWLQDGQQLLPKAVAKLLHGQAWASGVACSVVASRRCRAMASI
jgi:hypothetical protein